MRSSWLLVGWIIVMASCGGGSKNAADGGNGGGGVATGGTTGSGGAGGAIDGGHDAGAGGGGGGGSGGGSDAGDGGGDAGFSPAVSCAAKALAAGAHSCVLTTAGEVRCWGHNSNGQLGDGTRTDRSSPPLFNVLAGAQAITVGASHTCALTNAGGVRCWGANAAGQLGDGTTTDRWLPPATDVLTGVKAISAGTNHTCAVMTTGGVRCWGSNSNGQLGLGDSGLGTNRSAPPASDAIGDVQAIGAGGSYTCALTTAGGVRCWGSNSDGMLGDPSVSGRESPPTTDALVGVRAISVGSNHACAITTSDGLRCWGDDNSGEVGDGMPSVGPSTPPTDVILTGVRAVAAGGAQTCALMLAGGGVRCWGTAQSGALGDGSTDQRWTPPATDILTGVQDIASGGTFLTCAIMTGGGVRCWGSNAYGQAGNGMSGVNADVLTPTPPLRELSGACP